MLSTFLQVGARQMCGICMYWSWDIKIIITVFPWQTKDWPELRFFTTSDKKLNRLAHAVSEDLAKSDHTSGQKNHTAKRSSHRRTSSLQIRGPNTERGTETNHIETGRADGRQRIVFVRGQLGDELDISGKTALAFQVFTSPLMSIQGCSCWPLQD
jgi:hypothetical protein